MWSASSCSSFAFRASLSRCRSSRFFVSSSCRRLLALAFPLCLEREREGEGEPPEEGEPEPAEPSAAATAAEGEPPPPPPPLSTLLVSSWPQPSIASSPPPAAAALLPLCLPALPVSIRRMNDSRPGVPSALSVPIGLRWPLPLPLPRLRARARALPFGLRLGLPRLLLLLAFGVLRARLRLPGESSLPRLLLLLLVVPAVTLALGLRRPALRDRVRLPALLLLLTLRAAARSGDAPPPPRPPAARPGVRALACSAWACLAAPVYIFGCATRGAWTALTPPPSERSGLIVCMADKSPQLDMKLCTSLSPLSGQTKEVISAMSTSPLPSTSTS